MFGIRISLAAACGLVFSGAFAHAQEAILNENRTTEGPLIEWLECDKMLAHCGGARDYLDDHGIDLYGGYTAEVWGNTTGGLKQGAVYDGVLQFGTDLEFGKLIGWKGASFNTSWLWLSGRDPSANLVGNFMSVSSISGTQTLRMFEMWFQQDFFERPNGGHSGVSLRIGQIAADQEFVLSKNGALFLNGTFGWPPFVSSNIPNGGPAYPIGAPGVRLAISPVEWFTFQTAVTESNVFAQNVNLQGFRWELSRSLGYFWINEAQVRWNHQDNATGLPGQLKVGAWFDSASDIPLANGSGNTWGNSGYYAIVDQQLYSEPADSPAPTDGKCTCAGDGKECKSFKEAANPPTSSGQGLGCFARVGFGPQDRSFVGFYCDGGLVYTGLIPGRDNDQCGIAVGYSALSNGAADTLLSKGQSNAGYEMAIEGTYSIQITKWLQIQPDTQYIIRPGGSGALGNAFVLGARATVTF